MSRPSLLAIPVLAWVLLSACGSQGEDDAVPGPGFNTGAGGSGTAGAGEYGGTGPGASGGAGTGDPGPEAGTGGTGGSPVTAPSDACNACVRGVCLNCPADEPACEPCSVEPALCEGRPSEALRLCICEDKCAEVCGGTTYCPSVVSPPTDNGDSQSCFDNKPEDDGNIDCDAPRCESPCVSPCFQPPRLTVGTAPLTTQGRWKGHANVLTPPCALDPQSGPDIVYEVTSQVTGFVRVRVASEADALVSVRSSCQQGTELFCRNDVGASGSEELTFPVVAAEPLWLVVGAAKPLAAATYELEIQALEATCHDGVVTPDEECDTGPNDGACVDCHLVACQDAQAVPVGTVATLPAGTTSAVQPSCVPLDHAGTGEHIYAVRAEADGRFEAVLRSAGHDLTLSVRGSCQAMGAELGCSDDAPAGAGATERLVVPAVKGQTFYVVVESFEDGPPGDYTLWTRSSGLVCGDGEVGVTEQCDPGKGNEGACTAHCTTPLPSVAQLELEPNDLSYQAKSAGSEVGGEIFPPGDVDLHRIEITDDGPFVATIEGAAGDGSCDASLPGGLLDSELRLHTLDGALVGRNDNAVGVCSSLSLPLTKGTYLLEVRASTAAPEQVFSYILRTSKGVASLP